MRILYFIEYFKRYRSRMCRLFQQCNKRSRKKDVKYYSGTNTTPEQ